ncbi:MAG TPA: L-serine ammonia-lyase [Saprospiraceae bacterium]|nr:L-serine ammonia-lyase [Saprospiraceae bacterium]HRG65516.1 L-serine ammonia-lyase [Saprospiraceae bacterium]
MGERISIFDIFKIGIGPSSSHTMGPWKAALDFGQKLIDQHSMADLISIDVWLYGSLAKTGKGHGTDMAVVLGLTGRQPESIPVDDVIPLFESVDLNGKLDLMSVKSIDFHTESNIHFLYDQMLPFHANALTFVAHFIGEHSIAKTYYSLGGGFVLCEGEEQQKANGVDMPYPIDTGEDLKKWCEQLNSSIAGVVMQNEKALREEQEIKEKMIQLWQVMKTCIFESCKKSGSLPGGLDVQRRAYEMAEKLLPGQKDISNADIWMAAIKNQVQSFSSTLKWLSCFALAVNEENANYGRIVTAPTNGAAGVIPAVLMYHLLFSPEAKEEDIFTFFLVAGEMGSLFKKGATISAAMGGCQAEIGVSSAMAAAALTECLGGSSEQAMMAAEIAMEHHLGMTCDPIGGLVQIPCIERNTMGAIKAVTASQIALESDPAKAKVTLDGVIRTMKQTADDMHHKYKETSDGGLAIHIPVNIVEC